MLCFFYLKLQLAAKKKKSPKSPKTPKSPKSGGRRKPVTGEEKQKSKKATRPKAKNALTPEEIVAAKQLKAAKTALLSPQEVFAKQLKAEKAAAKRIAGKSARHALTLGKDECLTSDSESAESEDDSEHAGRKRVRCVQ